jgi:hypothetical protein
VTVENNKAPPTILAPSKPNGSAANTPIIGPPINNTPQRH